MMPTRTFTTEIEKLIESLEANPAMQHGEITMHVQNSHRNSERNGYSLLEVILALALTVILLGVISMAIRTNLLTLSQQRIRIERKQIARAALEMVGNDLRAGIQFKAEDYGGLENLMNTQEMMTGMLGLDLGETSDSEEEAEPYYDEDAVSFRPAFFGVSNALVIDVSRSPRLDEYNSLTATGSQLQQTPSDIKSVSYFFSTSDGGQPPVFQFEQAAPGGLYRREIDRAVATFAGETGVVSEPDDNAKLISPEVAEIRFRYFDGSDWNQEWDSVERNGFPLAVEVILIIDPTRTMKNDLTYSYIGFDRETMEQFRTVVHLPLSEIIPVE